MANKIKSIREKLGNSQAELAKAAGLEKPDTVGQVRISQYEGDTRTPTFQTMKDIVKGLNKLGAKTTFEKVFSTK